ncbi:Restriction of telomere capping protein 5 [Nakaseomyces bracarensis]|uniref:Restriction of telomere capping protein 5 n=1 Tax=Nakaseomyces bracarensis TaxID=273131 RepID=A0ABR4NXC4_9SACH
MGQATSSQADKFASRAELLEYFDARAVKLFTVPELVSFKARLQLNELQDAVSEDILVAELDMEPEVQLTRRVFKLIKLLQNFPVINTVGTEITGYGLLKTMAVLNADRFRKYVNSKARQEVLLLIGLFDADPGEPSKELDLEKVLSSYDGIDTSNISVNCGELHDILTWLLALAVDYPTKNCIINRDDTKEHIKDYERCSSSILHTVKQEAVKCCADHRVTLDEFISVLDIVLQPLFNPLSNFFEHLLFRTDELVMHQNDVKDVGYNNLLSPAIVAQFSLSLPKKIQITKLQKLYIGKEHGFSMRSLQAKVFKWMAPTIMIIRGTRIVNDDLYADKKNPRYKNFLEHYPKLKDTEQKLDLVHASKKKVTYVIYIDEPWKVTNKEKFGGENMTIIELTPIQETYLASAPRSSYFNTVGGGIGFGCDQPKIKPNQIRYKPGNVSLTIDSNLEFGVFRHVSRGGTFNIGSVINNKNGYVDPFEIRFVIQAVEVWGCGGEKELAEQLKELEWEQAEVKRRQAVNLKSLSEDRALLEMAGLVGQSNSGGSV